MVHQQSHGEDRDSRGRRDTGADRLLLATPEGDSRIDLVWTTTDPASTSYEIEWSADGETGWQAVDPPDDGEDTIHSHTGLQAETTYFYRVRGVNEHGEGPWALARATTASDHRPKPRRT